MFPPPVTSRSGIKIARLKNLMATPSGDAKASQEHFRRFTKATGEAVGSPAALLCGILATVIWAALGPVFHFSDTWQLVMNTGTDIATFLIVFVIQYTQNRDTRVLQLKLDELIRALGSARTELVSMEGKSDEELENLTEEFQRVQARASKKLEARAQRKAPDVLEPPRETDVPGQ